MALVLVALFIVLPLAELLLIMTVAQSVGVGATFLALILFSVFGAMLVRREGVAVWRRANEQLAAGRIPAKELSDGVMILGGGALLLTPGFITDFVGLALLFPPTRALLRPLLGALFTARLGRTATMTYAGVRGAGAAAGRARRSRSGAGDPQAASSRTASSGESWARVVDVEVNDSLAIESPGRPVPPEDSGGESPDGSG